MRFDVAFFIESFFKIWQAAPLTLELTLGGFGLGFLLALICAILLYFNVPVAKQIIQFVVSFARGTPMILQIYLIYYALPYFLQLIVEKMGGTFDGGSIPTLLLVIIALGINRAAYLTETIRSGIEAVGKGEIEAAYSIGMTTMQVLRYITIPQALKICIPNFSTNFINILHGSSLAFYASLLEMTGTANILAQNNWKYFETFLASGLIYWLLTILVELITYGIERRMSRHERIA